MDAGTPPQFELDYQEVRNLIWNDESDIRLATILACGFVERYLPDLLTQRLPNLDGEFGKTFFNRSLRHAKQRIHLARALGLFDGASAQDIETLFDIRNWFAHHVRITNAEHPEITRLVAKLGVIERAEAKGDLANVRASGPALCLRAACHGITTTLRNALANLT